MRIYKCMCLKCHFGGGGGGGVEEVVGAGGGGGVGAGAADGCTLNARVAVSLFPDLSRQVTAMVYVPLLSVTVRVHSEESRCMFSAVPLSVCAVQVLTPKLSFAATV